VDVGLTHCLVNGSTTDFVAAVDALLGNVFAHTPSGTSYRVSLQKSDDKMAELIVADDGPGIEDVGLLERGASGGSSTGLGVDIVRRTAEAARGSAHWEAGDPSGTVVRLVLPIAGTTSAVG
jgi:signal transduction histidine kinase